VPTTQAPAAKDSSHTDASFHAVQRRLATLLPDAAILAGGVSLELSSTFAQERPRLDPAELIEGKSLKAIDVVGDPVVRFHAFLDGTQSSRIAQYIGGVPIVHGTVASVIRERVERRMITWGAPRIGRKLYAPLNFLPAQARAALSVSGVDVTDTSAGREIDSIHPFALQDAALQAVQRDRAALERELAETWCASEDKTLFIDGGISESEKVAGSENVVGVVKSHQQLYVHGDDLNTLLQLQAGQRSSVVRVAPRRRSPVASWYLRLRGASAAVGRDPLWGLVRVEIAEPAKAPAKQIAARANEVSRWVLAEALPLAVPDGRWDKMVYGIRDCEEYLRAIQ